MGAGMCVWVCVWVGGGQTGGAVRMASLVCVWPPSLHLLLARLLAGGEAHRQDVRSSVRARRAH